MDHELRTDKLERLLESVYDFIEPTPLSSWGDRQECALCFGYDKKVEGVVVFKHTDECPWEEMEELYG